MSNVDPWALACAGGLAGGVTLLVSALTSAAPAGEGLRARAADWFERFGGERPGRRVLGAAAGAGAGLVLTGWPVMAPLGALAAWKLPALLGPDRRFDERVARIQALASWTEQLRDTLAAAAGLEQGIRATAELAPAPLRPYLATLVVRLDSCVRLPDALTAFGEELADPVADLVVIALIGAGGRQAGRLGELLTALASAARAQVTARVRTAASRARIRTATRVITATTLLLALALSVINHDYLAPYQTGTGQLALLGVGGLFALGLHWIAKIGSFPEPPRLLRRTPKGAPQGEGGVR
ncbi:type II secretion system F family protein [Streptacidiphilus sp. MAP5-3]|uniref:type II secretion system F family protein n=1 Tax=unclassified Streptacidiphilus TaxID=2643834 RepID=UPI003518CEF0